MHHVCIMCRSCLDYSCKLCGLCIPDSKLVDNWRNNLSNSTKSSIMEPFKFTKKSRSKPRSFTDEVEARGTETHAAAMRRARTPQHTHKICRPKMKSRRNLIEIEQQKWAKDRFAQSDDQVRVRPWRRRRYIHRSSMEEEEEEDKTKWKCKKEDSKIPPRPPRQIDVPFFRISF